MRELKLKDVENRLSKVVDEVLGGEPVVISQLSGKAVVLLSWNDWQRLSNVPAFARLLMASPLEEGDLEPRARSVVRDISI